MILSYDIITCNYSSYIKGSFIMTFRMFFLLNMQLKFLKMKPEFVYCSLLKIKKHKLLYVQNGILVLYFQTRLEQKLHKHVTYAN